MHCSIFDAQLGEKEIHFNTDIMTFDPCGHCLGIIMDAAFSDGVVHDEDEYVVLDGDWDAEEAFLEKLDERLEYDE